MSVPTDDGRTTPSPAREDRKYYLADEVDARLRQMGQDAEAQRRAMAALDAQYRDLIVANQKQAAVITSFRERNAELERHLSELEAIVSEQVQEISALGGQITNYRKENTDQTERIAQQNVQLSRMQSRIDHLGEQITLLESQNPDEVVQEAVRRADQIVQKAISDSDHILLNATEQRGRLIAACRAAYYSALQFKQDLAEQFRSMEKELDASIDVLQLMDNSRLAFNHTATPTELEGSQGTVTP